MSILKHFDDIVMKDGKVFLFAKPGQVATQPPDSGAVVRRGARSGNANFDPVTGKFAGKKGKDEGERRVTAQTANMDPLAFQRRKDMVRAAAMMSEEFTMTTASKWLEEFGVDVASARVDEFLADVRDQKIDYLVDAMRPALRTTVDAAGMDDKAVKLKVPASWSSGMLNSLTDGEVLQLYQRLSGQGFDPEDVAANLVKRVRGKSRKTALQQLFGESTGPKDTQPQGEGG